VETTAARAKEARRVVEKLITLARQDTLHHRRLARRKLMPRTGLLRMREGSHREAPGSGDIEKEIQAGRSPSSVDNSVKHLFEHVAPQYQDRPGGYSRIIRVGTRQGDGAEMVMLQLVDYTPPEV
jgi:large subunit ribosomal protein L17